MQIDIDSVDEGSHEKCVEIDFFLAVSCVTFSLQALQSQTDRQTDEAGESEHCVSLHVICVVQYT